MTALELLEVTDTCSINLITNKCHVQRHAVITTECAGEAAQALGRADLVDDRPAWGDAYASSTRFVSRPDVPLGVERAAVRADRDLWEHLLQRRERRGRGEHGFEPSVLRESGGGANGWSDQDLQDGFVLTGMFLLRHVLEPRGQGHSDARDGFINAVTKHRAKLAAD